MTSPHQRGGSQDAAASSPTSPRRLPPTTTTTTPTTSSVGKLSTSPQPASGVISAISGTTHQHASSASTYGRGSGSPLFVVAGGDTQQQQHAAVKRGEVKSTEPIYATLNADDASDEDLSASRSILTTTTTPAGNTHRAIAHQGHGLHKVLNPLLSSNRARMPPRSADAISTNSNIHRFDFLMSDSDDSSLVKAVERSTSTLHPGSRSEEAISKGIRAEIRSRQPRLTTIAASPLQTANFRRVRSDSTNEGDWKHFLASISAAHPELERALQEPSSTENTDASKHNDVFEPAATAKDPTAKIADTSSSFV